VKLRRTLARIGCTAAILALAAAAIVAMWTWLTWPDVAALADRNPTSTAFIERWRERRAAAGEPADPAWRPVPLERISIHLPHAVLVAEDIDFFSHRGFDRDEMEAAAREALAGGRVRGASTISQQLVKNLWLSPDRTPWRKVEEAILTVQLERRLSKRRILELYLNVVELGPGIFGAEAASRHWFGTGAARLDRRQAAMLAASLPRPSSWHPGVDTPGYRAAVDRTLRRMDRTRWLLPLLGTEEPPPASPD
jgi:monofunctional biosynthetic peptidoglycan transglycosylase